MSVYKVKVATGNFLTGGTFDSISITLVGSQGESAKKPLDTFGRDFLPGSNGEYHIQEEQDLGDILLIRLHKERYSFFPEDNWYCSKVTVESPAGKIYSFPCYRWIEGYLTVEIPEGTASLFSISSHPRHLQQREHELQIKQGIYRWKDYHKGFPKCIDISGTDELNHNAKYSLTKSANFAITRGKAVLEIKLKGFKDRHESWKTLDDIKRVFWTHRTAVSEYVSEHWREDTFFGYQFLNGVDPTVIRKCTTIPSNFPVTNEMVTSSLGKSTNLQNELQQGNVFIVDFKILEGIPANKINGQQQYMAAPLCLLYRTSKDEMIPLAIQLNQTPGPESPIFLPSDDEWDWTLAKIWVRNSLFHVHQALTHYLRTHALAEVFCIATIRQLPMSHPLYKLLVPHIRYTLQINVLARIRLIGPGGTFDLNTANGVAGLAELIERDMASLSYTSLCLPDNLKSRGVESIPKYYYREDGMKIWLAIDSYVSSIVSCFYKGDEAVHKDPELQKWVAEIFKEGFLASNSTGIPSSLNTREELCKYLTMVIFTCSAQHAAVNSGQFDFLSWMPNGPSTMRQPPPKTKGTATLGGILEILPEVGTTTSLMVTAWLLSNEPGDMRPLGTFPEEHFTEPEPKLCIEAFQERLAQISSEIQKRNESLVLKYLYLDPKLIENSVSI